MSDIPVGYVISMIFPAVCVGLGLRPRPTNGPRATPSFVLATVGSELPILMLVLVVASTVLAATEGDLDGPAGKAAAALGAVTVGGIGVSVVLAARTFGVLESALRAELGASGWVRPRTGPGELLRVVLAPLRWRRRDVVRVKDLRYGPAPGASNLLDVYRPRAQLRPGPVLVYFHGGGFFRGAKSREARLLLERFASRGWISLSANYRLRPAPFPAQVVDAKRIVAWLRTEGLAYGTDPEVVLVVGGSSGGRLAMMCAVTGNDPRFQPGFEDVDTRVLGAVGCYGYYGPAGDGDAPSAPAYYVRSDAPPVMVVHGIRDPMVPISDARTFATALRAVTEPGCPGRAARRPSHLRPLCLATQPRGGRRCRGLRRLAHRTRAGATYAAGFRRHMTTPRGSGPPAPFRIKGATLSSSKFARGEGDPRRPPEEAR